MDGKLKSSLEWPNGLWVVICMSECGISSLNCERINLARNMNTVTDMHISKIGLHACLPSHPV